MNESENGERAKANKMKLLAFMGAFMTSGAYDRVASAGVGNKPDRIEGRIIEHSDLGIKEKKRALMRKHNAPTYKAALKIEKRDRKK